MMATMPRFPGLTIPAAQSLNNAAARDRQIAAAADRALVPLIYGEDRIGALIANVLPAGANSGTLLVQCIWGYALDSINDVLLNDLALPAGATVTHYTGAQTVADAALVAAFAAQSITYTSTLAGYAYSVVAMPTRAFDGQLNVTARLRGRRLYDPRKDSTAGGSGAHRLNNPATWEWSDNPALADADFLASTLYGIGAAVDWASVPAAANAADALVGGERRRTVGVSFIAPATAIDMAETLRAYASCWHVPGPNGIRLVPDADGAAVATYTHAAGQIAAIQALDLPDLSSSPTAVEVVFTDTSVTPWRESSATATLPGAGNTLPWRLSVVRLPGVRRYSQALREATERLNKLRLGSISTTVDLFDEGIRHDVGDIIALTHPVGLSAQPMRVQGCTMTGPGRWRLDVTEHDPAAYSDAVATRSAAVLPSLVSPAGPPGAVTGFARVATLDDGTLLGWADSPEPDVTGYELRIGGTTWATAGPIDGGTLPTIVGATRYLWVQPGAGTYTLRIKALDTEGNASTGEGSPISVTVAATKLAGVAPGANATTIDGNGQIQGVAQGAGTPVANALLVPSINTAATTATWTGVSSRPTDESIRNNLIDLSWWRQDAPSPWPVNAEYNRLVNTSPSGGADLNVPGPKGDNDCVWYALEQTGDSEQGGGWNGGTFAAPLNPNQTYRFVLPVRRISGSGTSYWGCFGVCNLNTTSESGNAANPYFAFAALPSTDRWYLFVGYVYPFGSVGHSHDSAGVWDCKTGAKITVGNADGFNWNHGPNGVLVHRAYQFYSTPGAAQIFGRPMVNLVDGTEPSLREYFEGAAVLNAALVPSINSAATTATWSGVSGPGRPADNATVGAPAGTPVGSILAEQVESQTGAAAKATAARVAAEAAAAADAAAKANLAEVTAKAYADGIVDAEEARAIADATAKANAAQAAAIAAAAADATAKANAARAAAEATSAAALVNQPPFTLSASPASISYGTLGNGVTQTVTVTPSGGTAPYTYSWTLTAYYEVGGSYVRLNSHSANTASVTVWVGTATSTGAAGELLCVAIDKNGRAARATVQLEAVGTI